MGEAGLSKEGPYRFGRGAFQDAATVAWVGSDNGWRGSCSRTIRWAFGGQGPQLVWAPPVLLGFSSLQAWLQRPS